MMIESLQTAQERRGKFPMSKNYGSIEREKIFG